MLYQFIKIENTLMEGSKLKNFFENFILCQKNIYKMS